MSASARRRPPPSVSALLRDEGTGAHSVEEYLLARQQFATSYRARPLAELGGTGTLAGLLFDVRQFLDDFRRPQRDDARSGLIAAEPALTGDARRDALLAALAEHLATGFRCVVPVWALDGCRFLPSFWFVHGPAFDALALVQSPASFRRRGIFLSADFLSRV